jgi:DNA polymerase I
MATSPKFSAEVKLRYETVSTPARLKVWVDRATALGVVAFDTETSGLDTITCDLIGFSLAVAPGLACYVPLGHRQDGELVPDQIRLTDALRLLKPLLEDELVTKVGHNLAFDIAVMARHGIELR